MSIEQHQRSVNTLDKDLATLEKRNQMLIRNVQIYSQRLLQQKRV